MIAKLYGTSGCHLCDDAERLLAQAGAALRLDWTYIDIALNDELVDRYGTRIPVLLINRHELNWPFSLLDIHRAASSASPTQP
ncbi:glutaredoxin [Fluviicoccus keumensis]|uniref:Glutaredoxin n=1 Tax=Fluviicoccus keumensis TaxID=1435465 RepID=A0A4V2G611_9GAMM|nr:glutaredoxin family protein [Fluviicoccus keumensis]RZU46886.1 glutaredoxin [Fluviicoccus keumensis]